MKIEKIEVQNFKAVDNAVVEFGGCSAIITAGNNKGKTSMLRGLIDRLLGEKPQMILRQGTEDGFNVIHLTDGSKIEWSFNEKGEKLSYTTKEGIKQTTGVIKAIGKRFFGQKFDIDNFLRSTPKAQLKMLQEIVGLDFSELDQKYQDTYYMRTENNKILKQLEATKPEKPIEVEQPDLQSLLDKRHCIYINIQNEKSEIDKYNEELKFEYQEKNKTHIREIEQFNIKQDELQKTLNLYEYEFGKIEGILNKFFDCFDFKKAEELVKNLEKPHQKKLLNMLPEPKYKSYPNRQPAIDEINEKIEQANAQIRNHEMYQLNLDQYRNHIIKIDEVKEHIKDLNKELTSIEKKKKEMVQNANIPDEFKIEKGEILYNGFPIDNTQISSSSKYIAALKLGSMVCGEVRSMHFDASFLDRVSLEQIQEWAHDNNLQLLIERPDFDAGDIKYEIVEH